MHSFQLALKIGDGCREYGIVAAVQQIVREKVSARGQPNGGKADNQE
jgi:hypothetical protein